MRGKVVMIGTARDVRGGISALVNVYFAGGLFERRPAAYIATHCDGSKARKAWRAGASWLHVMGLLVAGRVALLHVHIATGASFWRKALFVLPARALGVPYILHMHGGDFDRFHDRAPSWKRRLIRSLYSRAFAVVALSEEWRAVISAAVPQARIVVIPNPVEIPAWQASLRDGPPTVAYLGVIQERKGVHDLLRAWPAVLATRPDAQLVIAGSGDGESAARLASELGVAERIEWTGWIGAEAKANLLRRAWILVLPSHFEALPMAVLEAMAAGVPVVATRVGAIPEAVDESCGILVDPRAVDALGAAMTKLIGDEEARMAMGREARRRAAGVYSAGRVIPQVERLWTQALDSPNGLGRHVSGGHA